MWYVRKSYTDRKAKRKGVYNQIDQNNRTEIKNTNDDNLVWNFFDGIVVSHNCGDDNELAEEKG